MTRRESDSLTDADPHNLLFGNDDADDDAGGGQSRPDPRITRADRRHKDRHGHHSHRHRRRGRLVVLVTVLIVAAVALLVVPRVVDYFSTKDYSGSGSGSVTITVHSGDSASDIATMLYRSGVVESQQAFTEAASADSASQSIQPGRYDLRKHMSGKSALALLLDPKARDSASDVVVTEGATVVNVEANLQKALGSSQHDAIVKAIENANALGLPIDYRTGARDPSSVEGFLYPATYPIDPGSAPLDVLEKMVTRFTAQDRSTGFTDAAKKAGLTPYQALIIASIAQAEAKFAADMPKVARVILNRIQAGKPLQIDATSAYAAKLNGLDPTKVIYAEVKGPYNTYHHSGLPPTPIDNPGSEAMNAAVHPAAGNWLFYVNGDAAGHLFFTHSEKAFLAASNRCRKNKWGC